MHARAIFTENLLNCLIPFLAGKGVVIHNGAIHLCININGSDSDKFQSFIVNARQFVADDLAQDLAEACLTGVTVR